MSIPNRRRLLLGCACCAFGSLLRPAQASARRTASTAQLGAAPQGDDGPVPPHHLAVAQGEPSNRAGAGAAFDWRRTLLQGERTLWLKRGDEEIRSTYWTPGVGYDGDAYKEICWLLRDVQASKSFAMSPRLLDVLCGLQNWLALTASRADPGQLRLPDASVPTIRTEGSAMNSRHILGERPISRYLAFRCAARRHGQPVRPRR